MKLTPEQQEFMEGLSDTATELLRTMRDRLDGSLADMTTCLGIMNEVLSKAASDTEEGREDACQRAGDAFE